MRGRLVLGALLSLFGLGLSNLEAKHAGPALPPPITVFLCDKAAISIADRLEARAQAERIFANASVRLHWVDDACQAPPPMATYLSIVILPQFPKTWSFAPDAMGLVVVPEGPYPRAYVSFDLVREFDRDNNPGVSSNVGILLGHAIAHELGHLLGQPHSVRGIMRAHWGHNEWAAAVAGRMRFVRPVANTAGLVD